MEKPKFTDFRNLFEYRNALKQAEVKIQRDALARELSQNKEIKTAIREKYPNVVKILDNTVGVYWFVSQLNFIVSLNGKEIYRAPVAKRRPPYYRVQDWFIVFLGEEADECEILSEQEVISGIANGMPSRG